PRALERRGSLKGLFTDFWDRRDGWIGFGRNGRCDSGLAAVPVSAANVSAIRFELTARARGRSGWELMRARNEWFQRFVLAEFTEKHTNGNAQRLTLFAYSYSANHLFEFARQQGWTTVLGQIDPGPAEEE